MANDPRVDAYIAQSAEFARPILEHIRATVHAACPDVEEGIKWGMPHFGYKGAMMCGMAAFKQHCAMNFWLHKELFGDGKEGEGAMGQLGRITSLRDLPAQKAFTALVKRASKLVDDGVRQKRPKASTRPAPTIPDDLAAMFAQRKHAAARKIYDAFSPSAQREYVDWINEARTTATRDKRIATTLEWLAEGKPRNWKYM
ncbi:MULTISPECIES: YdeI/OmpD-associated family protein [Dyella]|uniref:YdhG-like domain-containing protein n=2 Tax=Dyella TaxID=231454 RepID=A0A4V2NM99_9GAMM|nr:MULTISPECIES: YdeI/OmpD-associated family protein [Dyella]TBR39892.1 hypothetical protein EYV96_06830 [Dyella terrae]TCI12527.1 hypothetical protein EZM97_04040 [Dyella soli]